MHQERIDQHKVARLFHALDGMRPRRRPALAVKDVLRRASVHPQRRHGRIQYTVDKDIDIPVIVTQLTDKIHPRTGEAHLKGGVVLFGVMGIIIVLPEMLAVVIIRP